MSNLMKQLVTFQNVLKPEHVTLLIVFVLFVIGTVLFQTLYIIPWLNSPDLSDTDQEKDVLKVFLLVMMMFNVNSSSLISLTMNILAYYWLIDEPLDENSSLRYVWLYFQYVTVVINILTLLGVVGFNIYNINSIVKGKK